MRNLSIHIEKKGFIFIHLGLFLLNRKNFENNLFFFYKQTKKAELSRVLQSLSSKAKTATEFVTKLKSLSELIEVFFINSKYLLLLLIIIIINWDTTTTNWNFQLYQKPQGCQNTKCHCLNCSLFNVWDILWESTRLNTVNSYTVRHERRRRRKGGAAKRKLLISIRIKTSYHFNVNYSDSFVFWSVNVNVPWTFSTVHAWPFTRSWPFEWAVSWPFVTFLWPEKFRNGHEALNDSNLFVFECIQIISKHFYF